MHNISTFLLSVICVSAIAADAPTSSDATVASSRVVYQTLTQLSGGMNSSDVSQLFEHNFLAAGEAANIDSLAGQVGTLCGVMKFIDDQSRGVFQSKLGHAADIISIVERRRVLSLQAFVIACQHEIGTGVESRVNLGISILDTKLTSELKNGTLAKSLKKVFAENSLLSKEPRVEDELIWVELFTFFPSQTVVALCVGDGTKEEKTIKSATTEGVVDLAVDVAQDLTTVDWIEKDRVRVLQRVSKLMNDPRWFVRVFAIRCMGLQPQVESVYPLRDPTAFAGAKDDKNWLVRRFFDLAKHGDVKFTQ